VYNHYPVVTPAKAEMAVADKLDYRCAVMIPHDLVPQLLPVQTALPATTLWRAQPACSMTHRNVVLLFALRPAKLVPA
jgi:hypothetical protein